MSDLFKRFRNKEMAEALTGVISGNQGQVQYKKLTLTGSELKALCVDAAANASETITLASGFLPAGSVLVGGIASVTVADTGTATTTVLTLGTTSSSFIDLIASVNLRSVAKTGVAATFVPLLAGGVDLKGVLTVTGSGKFLSDIANATSVTIYVGYSTPEAV